jgi:hypothetical protein
MGKKPIMEWVGNHGRIQILKPLFSGFFVFRAKFDLIIS